MGTECDSAGRSCASCEGPAMASEHHRERKQGMRDSASSQGQDEARPMAYGDCDATKRRGELDSLLLGLAAARELEARRGFASRAGVGRRRGYGQLFMWARRGQQAKTRRNRRGLVRDLAGRSPVRLRPEVEDVPARWAQGVSRPGRRESAAWALWFRLGF